MDTSAPQGWESSQTPALIYTIFDLHSQQFGAERMPLVMVHGALVSRRYLMPVAELMAKQLTVYVPDLPGHGNSTKPPHALAVTAQADALHAWMLERGFSQVNLLGHSYGCEIVAELTAKYPEMIHKLVLASPASDPNVKTLVENFFRLTMDGFLENPKMPLVLLRDLWDMGIIRAFETAHEMMAYKLRSVLPIIKTPTLVIRGENDLLVSQKWVDEICTTLAHAKVEVVPNGPHNINFSTPEKLAPLLIEYLY